MVRVPPLVGPVGAVVGAVVAAAVVGASVAAAVVGATVGAAVVAVGKAKAVGAGATVAVGTAAGAAHAPNNTLTIMICDRAINKLLCFMILSPLSARRGKAWLQLRESSPISTSWIRDSVRRASAIRVIGQAPD